MRLLAITGLLSLLALLACKKDTSFAKTHLNFSQDTVLFDTIFTTVGSTTQRFKLYNRNRRPVRIEQIELMGGETSPFRINVDGVPADYLEGVEVPADDSLFVFVEVTLDVNNASLPMVVSDSIRFLTNGVNQYVYLDVWGQDAYFHNDELVSGVWASDKPHVIYGVAAVGFPGVDSNLTLTIPAGTRVYGHKGAQLVVYKSSIDIQGSYGQEVVFQGDRLEPFYREVDGQWWGIRLVEAQYSTIDYAIIKNGAIGLQVDSTQGPQTLRLTNTIVDNHTFFGLNVNAGAAVQVENCLFGDAGICSAYLFAGGEYRINHCHFVNYWKGSRDGQALLIQNHFTADNTIYVRPVLNSTLVNSLVDGNARTEFKLDTLSSVPFTMDITHCYLKRSDPYNYPAEKAIIWGGDPRFVDAAMKDFHLLPSSPLRNAGDPLNTLGSDLEGNARLDGQPDLGCYEGN